MTSGRLDAAELGVAVARRLGSETVVEELRRLSGGASKETWSFDAVTPAGPRLPLILRRDPPGDPGAVTKVDEYGLLSAAAAAGVPVAKVRFPLGEGDGLGRGFVMDRIEGETLGRRIVRDEAFAEARDLLAHQCGEILARIHAIPADSVGLRGDGGLDSALAQVTQFEQILDGFDVARPVLELGLRWLRGNVPPARRGVVLHGDFRVGNLMIGSEGVRAVLDWELAHIGHPAEDLGWLCVRSWRFGGAGTVGGVGTLEDLLTGYRAGGGTEIDPSAIRYFEVLGNVKWGVICVTQAYTHLHRLRRSVELAAIGRRVCEVESDLMELLG